MLKKTQRHNPAIEPAGYAIARWAPAAGISKALFYTLPDNVRPRSVTVGARRIIIESPADWLKRIADRGGVSIVRECAATGQAHVSLSRGARRK